MFFEIYNDLCRRHGVAPTTVMTYLGISKGSIAKWKEGSVPRESTLLKIANYFGVSVDYLLGKEEKEKAPEEPKLSEGEAMLLEAIRDVPEDQRPALLMELMRIALKNQK